MGCASGPLPGGPAEAAAAAQPYKLGSGDMLRIITFNEPTLTGEFAVSGSGGVDLPLIGEIKAVGLTPTEFQAKVAETLSHGYMQDPKVSVEVEDYRPFYILGEVNKAGVYPYASRLTVLMAVAVANGFTYRGDQRHVFIKHDDGSAEQSLPLTTSTPVMPGDTIRIPERYY